METQVLTDPLTEPDNTVLENALGNNYKLYEEFITRIQEQNLVPEWNYYNDGKTWLGKILCKKKNLCWLSVWNTGFKLTFYFPGKAVDGLFALDIDDDVKKLITETKPVGKSQPVILLIKNKKFLLTGLKLLEYKKSLK